MSGLHRFLTFHLVSSLLLGAAVHAQSAGPDPILSASPSSGSPTATGAREPSTPGASGQQSQGAQNSPGWIPQGPATTGILGALIASGALGLVYMFRHRRHRITHEPEPPVERATQAYTPPGVLEDVDGATSHQTYDITGKLTWVSRAPGEDSATVRTIVIRDDTISRDHALIQYRDHGYWISDRGSANGTFVNDAQIRSERLLKHGDRLRFARFEFIFQLPQIEGLPETVFVRLEDEH